MLAKHTHRISVFAEGMLAMEETKLGMIKKLTQEKCSRMEFVRSWFAQCLMCCTGVLCSKTPKNSKKNYDTEGQLKMIAMQLQGFKTAFEYIQDYVSIYGLKMWQEEFSRIVQVSKPPPPPFLPSSESVNLKSLFFHSIPHQTTSGFFFSCCSQFNVEQECNVFLKKKVIPQTSIYWKRAIPIPMYNSIERGTSNFMGRLCNALLRITDYRTTVYATECLGWYLADGTETAGIKLFTF